MFRPLLSFTIPLNWTYCCVHKFKLRNNISLLKVSYFKKKLVKSYFCITSLEHSKKLPKRWFDKFFENISHLIEFFSNSRWFNLDHNNLWIFFDWNSGIGICWINKRNMGTQCPQLCFSMPLFSTSYNLFGLVQLHIFIFENWSGKWKENFFS